VITGHGGTGGGRSDPLCPRGRGGPAEGAANVAGPRPPDHVGRGGAVPAALPHPGAISRDGRTRYVRGMGRHREHGPGRRIRMGGTFDVRWTRGGAVAGLGSGGQACPGRGRGVCHRASFAVVAPVSGAGGGVSGLALPLHLMTIGPGRCAAPLSSLPFCGGAGARPPHQPVYGTASEGLGGGVLRGEGGPAGCRRGVGGFLPGTLRGRGGSAAPPLGRPQVGWRMA